jgi:hypothetical protein
MLNLQQIHKEEIDNFNYEYDEIYNELARKHENLQTQLNESHTKEYEERMQEFNQCFPEKNPKHTPEILDLYRKLEGIVKKKQ